MFKARGGVVRKLQCAYVNTRGHRFRVLNSCTSVRVRVINTITLMSDDDVTQLKSSQAYTYVCVYEYSNQEQKIGEIIVVELRLSVLRRGNDDGRI